MAERMKITDAAYVVMIGNDKGARVLDEMRDRLVRLETKLDALPTKDWFGGVIRNTITAAAALVAIAGAPGALLLHLLGK